MPVKKFGPDFEDGATSSHRGYECYTILCNIRLKSEIKKTKVQQRTK